MPYREKRIYSGDYFEVELFPVTKQEISQSRKEKEKLTKPKQRNLNHKNAIKHLIRLINSNFTKKDLAVHLTYDDENLPHNEDQSRKDIQNYIRRLKTALKKKGLPDLKYIAVIECQNPDEGRKGIRIHHHMLISGDLHRDEVETLWGKGRCNSDRLQPDEFGLEGLARYISKDPRGSKRWSQSKNLKQPIVKVNDHKYSRRKVDALARCQGERELIEALYPEYTLTSIEPQINEVTGSIYIYIKMRKKYSGNKQRKGEDSYAEECQWRRALFSG